MLSNKIIFYLTGMTSDMQHVLSIEVILQRVKLFHFMICKCLFLVTGYPTPIYYTSPRASSLMFKRLCASVASIDSGAANECCPARLRIAQIISRHQPSNRQYKLLMHVINKVFYKVIVNNLFGKRVQGFHKFYQISNPNILRDRAGLLRNSSKSAMQ